VESTGLHSHRQGAISKPHQLNVTATPNCLNMILNYIFTMHLKLYREFLDCPVGHKPGWTHKGIRDINSIDCFENIARAYDYTIEYTTHVSDADLVVFNLNRNHIYTNLNPILLLDSSNLLEIAKSTVPVVFWHSGESHLTVTASWFTASNLALGRPIWYVDSNYVSGGDQHLFFDSAEFFIERSSSRISALRNDQLQYNFFICTDRSDIHKHIVCNYLRKNHPSAYTHYLNPMDLDQRYHQHLVSFDKSTPQASQRLTESQIGNIINQTMVILSLNSYFIKDFGSPESYVPLYITEKFLVDLMTNKPVVPIGHSGSVGYCKQLGFEFPNWIDYSYDDIKNDDDRMSAILNEVDRLSNLDLAKLSQEFSSSTDNMTRAKNFTAKPMFLELASKIGF